MDLSSTNIRVSCIDPGMVETEFSVVRLGNQMDADKVYKGMTPLTPKDIAEIIVFTVTRPEHVNISEVLVLPTDQSSATLINRKGT